MQTDAKRKGLHQSEALQGNGYEGLQNSKKKHDPGGQQSLETAATAEVLRKLTTLSDRKINDRQGSSQPIKKQKLIPKGDKPATAATIMGYYDEGQGKNKCVIHKNFITFAMPHLAAGSGASMMRVRLHQRRYQGGTVFC